MTKRMFGTAGVRGVTNVEVTPEMTLRLAIAYGDLLAEKAVKPPTAGVGHDTRYGAELLARVAAAGLASAGCHVAFYGCVPTGVFAMNLARGELAGGILITGSHMPPDRIGIIACLGDGACAPADVTDRIEEGYRDFARRDRRVAPDKIGRIEEAFHPYELYVSEVLKLVDPRPIKDRRFRVLVDPANGAGSYVAKEIFEWYGCEVELLSHNPSPVPDRPSEPRAGTVSAAIATTREKACDLGLCLDVDADRALFLTRDGTPLSEDLVGAVFAKEELGRGDRCVVPINSSGLIELVCEEIGAELEYCPVGQPATIKAVKERGAHFSYEESGKYYFTRVQPWADGLYSGVKMLDIMTRRGKSLSELAAAFPRFHQVKHTVEVDDGKKEAVMETAAELLRDDLLEGRTRDATFDGFKRSYRDHSWLLIRKSGTEPLIRVYSDAPSRERAEELVREGTAVLRKAIDAAR